MDLYEKMQKREPAQHFMGPVVLKTQEQKIGGITRWVIIDGQQRFTTLLLLCALIRDKAQAASNISLAKEIEGDILYNQFAKNVEDKPKLCPTEADSSSFNAIVSGKASSEFESSSQLYSGYYFFNYSLNENKEKISLDSLLDCIRALKFVTIRLEETDNPNRIFETLNFRGKDLAQSDLVRNFFMMSISDPSKADQIYRQVWFPMQQSLGDSTPERTKNLETFFRHYIVMRDQVVIKESRIYPKIRGPLKNARENEVVAELQTIRNYSRLYEKLLFPKREPNLVIRKGIERLNRLNVGVSYPFLTKVYKAFADGVITEASYCSILNTIESYVIRRFFSKLPTHSLNRLFAELCKLPNQNLEGAVIKVLSDKENWAAQYWPKDSEFKTQILTQPLYMMAYDKCRFILETLEESFNHPEEVILSNLSVEHILPETLDADWQAYLGKEWETTYDKYVHTLGNLTLIAPSPNSSLQNELFAKKKIDWYLRSNVSLTKELCQNSDWKEKEIIERGNILADKAIKIWPRPGSQPFQKWFL